uniref:Uncharacterized protein n=1 Tax=Arion vulgaris TaxID=1028688 RepID=A0A0B6ZT48_9EUPU
MLRLHGSDFHINRIYREVWYIDLGGDRERDDQKKVINTYLWKRRIQLGIN